MSTTRRLAELGPLHDILLAASPTDDRGGRSVSVLADALGISAAGLYKVLERKKMTPMRALSILKVADCRITALQLLPFIETEQLEAFLLMRDQFGLTLDLAAAEA